MEKKTALIMGSSGLIGKALIQYLLNADEYEKIVSLVRTKQNIHHTKLTEHVIDFGRLDDYKEYFQVDDVFSCLGTTIKKAKSKDYMEKIDVEYPLKAANLAFKGGAKQFLFVSSMNANEQSLFWYSRLKAKLEKEVVKISFQAILIFRPSLLLGQRHEFRLGESIGSFLYKRTSFLFKGRLRKYKAIEGKKVAYAMYREAQKNRKGIKVYPSDKIEDISS